MHLCSEVGLNGRKIIVGNVVIATTFTAMTHSQRKIYIVDQIADGATISDIALNMERSRRTVERKISQIMEDYEAKNHAHLVRVFMRKKLIQ